MIIGLVGYIGSGKTTIAKILEKEHGYTRLSFADPLKEQCAHMIHWATPDIPVDRVLHAIHDPQGKHVYRGLLQWYGVYMRNWDPAYWVRQLEDRILSLKRSEVADIVIDDLRFPNEATMLRKQEAMLLRVHRPEVDRKVDKWELHESEMHVQDMEVDGIILNNTTVEDLDESIRNILEISKEWV